MLAASYTTNLIEAGCDEAGRGCLAGPVFASAVILPKEYSHSYLNDSKQINAKQREVLRKEIEKDALAWSVSRVDPLVIDKINILAASFLSMNNAIAELDQTPELVLIDGNRFQNKTVINHICIIKGDGKYLSIAAASILAKTYRDEYMLKLHEEYPFYGWDSNKGYPTEKHFIAIKQHGLSPYHRKSFNCQKQLKLSFEINQ